MKAILKIDLNEILQNSYPVVLELGSGSSKTPGRINIDKLDMPNVDIVADLEKGLQFLPDNAVDFIYSKSFLEHIDNLDLLMREIWRVLKPTGKKKLYVPHFSNPFYFSDYTHKNFFGLYSFEYFSTHQNKFKRKVPSFYHDFGFITEKLTLDFKSPWKSRNYMKRVFQKIINLNPWMMEFYEENLCYIIPCYGIKATLKPVK